jgi:hypothetical protein
MGRMAYKADVSAWPGRALCASAPHFNLALAPIEPVLPERHEEPWIEENR